MFLALTGPPLQEVGVSDLDRSDVSKIKIVVAVERSTKVFVSTEGLQSVDAAAAAAAG